jgi:hypothetical protein
MLHRKDYKKVADILKKTTEGLQNNTIDEPVRYIAHNLANMFKEDNPLFDYNKFFVACGLQ